MKAFSPRLQLIVATALGIGLGAGATRAFAPGSFTTRELKYAAPSQITDTVLGGYETAPKEARYLFFTADPARDTFSYLADPFSEGFVKRALDFQDQSRPPLKVSVRVLRPEAVMEGRRDVQLTLVPKGEGGTPGIVGSAPLAVLQEFQDANLPVVENREVAFAQTLWLRFWLPNQKQPSIVGISPRISGIGTQAEVTCSGWWPTEGGGAALTRQVSFLESETRWAFIKPTGTSPVIALTFTAK